MDLLCRRIVEQQCQFSSLHLMNELLESTIHDNKRSIGRKNVAKEISN